MTVCRKCRSKGSSILFIELYSGGGIEFTQTDSGQVGEGYVFEPTCIDSVQAKCRNCGHQWTLRGVATIDTIRERSEK